MGLNTRRERRARIAGHRHPRPRRPVPSPDPAAPPTWRAWKARTGGRWWRYPLAVEWALEWFVHRLRRLALFELLELAGKLTVVVAVVVWFLEADQRARQAEEAVKARHYRAWELINAARGSTGDGGRRDALQDLNRDHVSLAAAPLEQAHLPNIDLQDAILPGAHLQGAWLVGANLQDAILWNAKLQGAYLVGARLQGANLQGARLQGARLQGANLQGAIISQAQLDAAKGDDTTVLPDGLTRPPHWSKVGEPEAPPAAQPDAAEGTPPAAGAPGSDK